MKYVSLSSIRSAKFFTTDTDYRKGWNDAISVIEEQIPVVEIEPPKKALWLKKPYGYGVCSKCHKTATRTAYCGNCGAEMEGECDEM